MESEVGRPRQVEDQCRVSVHLDGIQTDLALPADIPVGQLIPTVYDILRGQGGSLPGLAPTALPNCLHRPGQPPFDVSMTLSQLGIRDGTLLILAAAAARSTATPVLHAADAVEQAAGSHPQAWTAQQSQLAALLVAIALAGVTGLAVVPDGLGPPGLLLGATSVAAAAAIATRVCRYGRTALMALTTVCTLVAAAALGATLLDVPPSAAGMALAVSAVGMLTIAGRLAVMMSGLSRYIGSDLDPDADAVAGDVWHRSVRAQQLLTALIVGVSISAALGAAPVALNPATRLPGYAAAGVIATLLISRSRSHHRPVRRTALLSSGMLCTTALFVGLRLADPRLTPWLCGAAVVVAVGALWFGFAPPAAATAPPLRRCLELLDCLALASLIPLACWSSGLYGLVRGMSL